MIFLEMMPVETWAQFVTQLRLSVALVLFFVWTGAEREKGSASRIASLEDFIRSNLLAATADSSKALVQAAAALGDAARAQAEATRVIQANTDAVRRLEETLETAMCPLSRGDISEAKRRHEILTTIDTKAKPKPE